MSNESMDWLRPYDITQEEIDACKNITPELKANVTEADWDKVMDDGAIMANKHFSAIRAQENQQVKFAPKGSRCIACKKKYEDCSGLDFGKMRELEKYKSTTIVICSEFERADK